MADITKNNRRRIWAAIMFSLIMPGLGHVYCGKLSRGLVLTFLNIIPLPIILGLFSFNNSIVLAEIAVILILFGFIVQLFAIIDSSRLAKLTSSDYQLKDYNRWYVYPLLIMIVSGGSIGSGLYLRDQCLEAFRVPTASCYPTIIPGDRILANKYAYSKTDPQRGDLIIFINPENRHMKYIKRVVAVAGDTVEIKNNELYINDQKLQLKKLVDSNIDNIRIEGNENINGQLFQETNNDIKYDILLSDSIETETIQDFAKITVPENHCFVLGDNRNNSYDSRNFGSIHLATVIGRADLIYWPGKGFSRFGSINAQPN